ncbi:ABC transporter ATP-binding protein [Pseudomonas sp. PDM14]|uniref:ABC transporter ATP-binding protein n=1 Tax=Pseudomonas sp. PDM14 TaxID=2769288 RepID=UPI001783A6D4|nr:ABC transporter ATP-binding protein [Pseudomonas sp. PDM14]MBD9485438.1 ABC transporter ATP-binding protein [Pseudomonas sp. PDM14]
MSKTDSLLTLRNLRVHFGSRAVVDGLDLDLQPGEILGLVGESGSGKSLSMLALLGLVDAPGQVAADTLRFAGQDLQRLSASARRRLLGKHIGLVFQDPLNALNPALSIGYQLGEVLRQHLGLRGRAARQRAIELLEQVQIPQPQARLRAYPHQLSGGMAQRVAIAIALAGGPHLLIADEPTTALDVTTQAQIIQLLLDLQRERGMALILISHDLALVAQTASRVCVMQHGRLVEHGPVAQVLHQPQHAYTRQLLAALPENHPPRPRPSGDSALLLSANGLSRHYALTRGWLRRPTQLQALSEVSFTLHAGRTLAVIGESGSGKSTLARLLTQIEHADGGTLQIAGRDVATLDGAARKQLRREVQMVFQNPFASLNPRQTIGTQLAEPLLLNTDLDRAQRQQRVTQMLQRVGLAAEHAERYPHMFSGGQRQRIAIARAMMLQPKILVADEPTSALDVSIQAQVLELFHALQAEFGTAYVFISHNLTVVRQIADQVLVLHRGIAVEQGSAEQVCERPQHPYTQKLLAATPRLETSVS